MNQSPPNISVVVLVLRTLNTVGVPREKGDQYLLLQRKKFMHTTFSKVNKHWNLPKCYHELRLGHETTGDVIFFYFINFK